MPELPTLIYQALKNSAEGQDQEQQLHEMQKLRDEVKRGNQRNAVAIGGASLLISAFILLGLASDEATLFMGAPVISWILGGIGAFFLLFSFQD